MSCEYENCPELADLKCQDCQTQNTFCDFHGLDHISQTNHNYIIIDDDIRSNLILMSIKSLKTSHILQILKDTKLIILTLKNASIKAISELTTNNKSIENLNQFSSVKYNPERISLIINQINNITLDVEVSFENQIQKLNLEIETRNLKIEEMNQKISGLQNQVSSFAENKKKEVKILFDQIRKCKSELKQAENNNKNLEVENSRLKAIFEELQTNGTISEDKIKAIPRGLEPKLIESQHENRHIEEISKLNQIIQSSNDQIQKQSKEINDLNMHIQSLNQINNAKIIELTKILQELTNEKDQIIQNQNEELQENQLKFTEISLLMENKDLDHNKQLESFSIRLNELNEKLNNVTKQNSILVQEIDQEKSKNNENIIAHEKKLKEVHSMFCMLKEQKESFAKKSETKLKNLEEINKNNQETIKLKEKELEDIYSKISTTTGIKDILKILQDKIQGWPYVEFNEADLEIKKTRVTELINKIAIGAWTKFIKQTEDGKYIFHCIFELGKI